MTQLGNPVLTSLSSVFRIIECAAFCIRKSKLFDDDLANLQKEVCLKLRHLKVILAISFILKMESNKSTFVISSICVVFLFPNKDWKVTHIKE